jgi:hypothetical protein
MNLSFMPGSWIDQLVEEGVLREECRRIFRIKSETGIGPERTNATSGERAD